MRTYLILDANYLSYRAFHSTGHLELDGMSTGTIYGVLFAAMTLQKRFDATAVVWAWDAMPTKRKEILKTYKSSRKRRHKEETEQKKRMRESFKEEMLLLRKEYLGIIGYKNVFRTRGYEADDIIASVVDSIPKDDRAVIISSDQDLWQLIRKNVYCYNPAKKEPMSLKRFHKEWGIEPPMWADVKAWAGCKSDDIPGVPGVGEKTAVKWIKGQISPSATYDKFVRGHDQYKKNLKLVTLPFKGCPKYTIREDIQTEEGWRDIANRLGWESFMSPSGLSRKPRGRKPRHR